MKCENERAISDRLRSARSTPHREGLPFTVGHRSPILDAVCKSTVGSYTIGRLSGESDEARRLWDGNARLGISPCLLDSLDLLHYVSTRVHPCSWCQLILTFRSSELIKFLLSM